MKANVMHQQRPSFPLKKYLPLQSIISSCSENSKHPWWSHFNIALILHSLFHLFRVVSCTFQPFPACYGLLQVFPLFTSDDVTECFDLQIHYKSTFTEECKGYYKAGQLFWITKRGKWYCKAGQVLPSGAIFIKK